jgi:TetR/AcrR family transcriptional regulator, cholesterol catabolism regulator
MTYKASHLNRKEQIDQIATALFQKRGFSATSMRDLATELGIEAASIYAHIRSKEEILHRICFRMADAFFSAMEQADQVGLQAGEKLRQVIIAHVKVLTLNPSASAVFLQEWRHLNEPGLSEFLQLREQYEARFRDILREGMESGEFKRTNEKFTALLLLSSLNWIPNWYKPQGPMLPDQIGESIATTLLTGIRI